MNNMAIEKESNSLDIAPYDLYTIPGTSFMLCAVQSTLSRLIRMTHGVQKLNKSEKRVDLVKS